MESQQGSGVSLARLRGALSLMSDATLLLDAHGGVLAANDLALEMFGYASGQLLGAPVDRLLPLVLPPADSTRAEAVPPRRVKLQGRRANGVPFPVEASVRSVIADDEPRVLCAVRELGYGGLIAEAQRYFDVAFENSPIGMALLNSDGEYLRVNASFCTLLGRSGDELIGRRDQELTHPEDRQADLDAVQEIFDGQRDTHQCEKRFVRPDESVVWTLANLTFLRDDEGRALSWVGQFQDISERRRQEQELRYMADHDPLTGLLNRRAFQRTIDHYVARTRRYGAEGAVLMVDLDGLKRVNDTLGHQAGDEVLASCGAALRGRLRESDVVARLGGDEFAVLLPNGGGAEAEIVAAALIEAVRERAGASVTASVGVAPMHESTPSAEALMIGADRAMYVAKHAGGDRYTVED